ncbi:MAG TPA: sigma-70 family RNA polymerase sigma factor [Pirellulales bacterium]|nr:sigma-70 family RNA polymerase sigma factor [Pirellulales bacterium]
MLDEQQQTAVAAGLREGSREAWAWLYDAYSTDVWRYVARLLGPDSAAVADAVQETFLEAARSARRFDPSRGSLWGWLTGIAHHRVAAYWRQAQRAAALKRLAESEGAAIQRWLNADAAGTADRAALQLEVNELVRAVLAELPADYAALLAGKYIDERSLEQLTRQFGGSVEAVKSKLARARREFRAKFERITREPTRSTTR